MPVFSRPHVKPSDLIDSARSLRRRLVRPPRRPLIAADVHEAVQECASRDHESAAAIRVARLERQTGNAAAVEQNPSCPPDDPVDRRMPLQRLAYPFAIAALVGLRARRPDGGTAAAIEQLELNARRVDRNPHQSAQRVDLADEMTLRGPADCRVARHVRDRRRRQRADADGAAHRRGRPRRLHAGMAGADHDDVEVGGIIRSFGCSVVRFSVVRSFARLLGRPVVRSFGRATFRCKTSRKSPAAHRPASVRP